MNPFGNNQRRQVQNIVEQYHDFVSLRKLVRLKVASRMQEALMAQMQGHEGAGEDIMQACNEMDDLALALRTAADEVERAKEVFIDHATTISQQESPFVADTWLSDIVPPQTPNTGGPPLGF